MFLAKVVGNVVATQKDKYLFAHKLLIVRAVDLNENFCENDDHIAIDLIDSGIGDLVLVVQEGDAVEQILGHAKAPVNTMIIASVDNINVDEK
ncbi:MAG: EutN/CcmL family microcompartment protein [bacterium]